MNAKCLSSRCRNGLRPRRERARSTADNGPSGFLPLPASSSFSSVKTPPPASHIPPCVLDAPIPPCGNPLAGVHRSVIGGVLPALRGALGGPPDGVPAREGEPRRPVAPDPVGERGRQSCFFITPPPRAA